MYVVGLASGLVMQQILIGKGNSQKARGREKFKAVWILVVTVSSEEPIIFTVRESVGRHQIVETGGSGAVAQDGHTALVS